MKKALVYIGGPRQLKDFIWLNLYLKEEYSWTLICQPMFPEMKLKETCEKSGLFDEIIQIDSYITKPKHELIIEFLKMFFFWLIGKNKYYARRTLSKFVSVDDYDLVVVSTTRGVTCGMMVLAANCSQIILMEDGNGDNTNPNERLRLDECFKLQPLMEYVSAKMGYFNINGRFPLKSTLKCDKFTENMESNYSCLYKSLNKLNDMKDIPFDKYEETVKKTFGEISDIASYDVVIFTSNMKDFTPDWEKVNNDVVDFIEKKYVGKRIALKKHPRDLSVYHFHRQEVYEVDSMVPAEELMPYLENQDIYFFFPSTTIKSMPTLKKPINIFRFQKLMQTEMGKRGKFNYAYNLERTINLFENKDESREINYIDL